MECKICGKYIEEGKRVLVEGSEVVTCDRCSTYGTIIGNVRRTEVKKSKKIEDRVAAEIAFEEGIIENYFEVIKNARQSRNLKQDDLANLINEQKALIRRIESGKIQPSIELAKKLEFRLKITLIQKQRLDIKPLTAQTKKELSLGDMVIVKDRRGKRK